MSLAAEEGSQHSAEVELQGTVKGTAGYYRLKPRILALELTEEVPGGGKLGDFVAVGADGVSGTLYPRKDFLEMFERVHFIEDFHEPRLGWDPDAAAASLPDEIPEDMTLPEGSG